MKTKKQIEDKMKRLTKARKIELKKPDLDQLHFIILSCEFGIRYLEWVIK